MFENSNSQTVNLSTFNHFPEDIATVSLRRIFLCRSEEKKSIFHKSLERAFVTHFDLSQIQVS